MAVWYGPSGYGKTRAAVYGANRFRATYVECGATWTQAKFCRALLIQLGLPSTGTVADMAERIIDALRTSRSPLIIDEFDHVVARKYVDLVREIHDQSGAAIILIGDGRRGDGRAVQLAGVHADHGVVEGAGRAGRAPPGTDGGRAGGRCELASDPGCAPDRCRAVRCRHRRAAPDVASRDRRRQGRHRQCRADARRARGSGRPADRRHDHGRAAPGGRRCPDGGVGGQHRRGVGGDATAVHQLVGGDVGTGGGLADGGVGQPAGRHGVERRRRRAGAGQPRRDAGPEPEQPRTAGFAGRRTGGVRAAAWRGVGVCGGSAGRHGDRRAARCRPGCRPADRRSGQEVPGGAACLQRRRRGLRPEPDRCAGGVGCVAAAWSDVEGRGNPACRPDRPADRPAGAADGRQQRLPRVAGPDQGHHHRRQCRHVAAGRPGAAAAGLPALQRADRCAGRMGSHVRRRPQRRRPSAGLFRVGRRRRLQRLSAGHWQGQRVRSGSEKRVRADADAVARATVYGGVPGCRRVRHERGGALRRLRRT
nr:ATP-binding protein [Azospirillum sp. INR13]